MPDILEHVDHVAFGTLIFYLRVDTHRANGRNALNLFLVCFHVLGQVKVFDQFVDGVLSFAQDVVQAFVVHLARVSRVVVVVHFHFK